MSTGLRLGEYSATPLYNIKAVVQATNITPSTLRAWERRYNIAPPQRSDSGYRLYSERDITVIRWLKTQVDAGMSISQAVMWLQGLIKQVGKAEHTILPMAGNGAPLHDLSTALPIPEREEVRDLKSIQQNLIHALGNYDEDAAEVAIAEAFSIYPVEHVGDGLFLAVLEEINERRRRGDFSITCEQFACNYLLHRLGTLLRSTPNCANGPLIWVGGISADPNEAGALLLAIYLRRTGYRVHYLGQRFGHNASLAESAAKDLLNEAKRMQPVMLLLSAATTNAALSLSEVTDRLVANNSQPLFIAFGGRAYHRNPEFRAATPGLYVGADAKELIKTVNELLADKHHRSKKRIKREFGNGNHAAQH